MEEQQPRSTRQLKHDVPNPFWRLAQCLALVGGGYAILYRFYDKEIDLYLPNEPWSDLSWPGKWKGLEICACDGTRGFSILEAMARRCANAARYERKTTVTLMDVGAGKLLPTYVVARRVLEHRPVETRHLHLVVTDTIYGEHMQGVYTVSPNAEAVDFHKHGNVLETSGEPSTAWYKYLLFQRPLISSNDSDNKNDMYVLKFLEHCQALANVHGIPITVSVFGDILQPFEGKPESLWSNVGNYATKSIGDDGPSCLVMFHVHFEQLSRINPFLKYMRENFYLAHDDQVWNPVDGTIDAALRPFRQLFGLQRPARQTHSFVEGCC